MTSQRVEASFLVPVYNGRQHLESCLRSLLAQSTSRSFEVVLVDDGSADGSWELAMQVAESDARLRVFRNEVNGGQAAAANRAFRLSSGAVVLRQDQDDLAFPDRLEAQLNYLDRHPEVGLLGSAYYRWTEDRLVERRPPGDHTRLFFRHLFACRLCHSSVAFRRSCLEAGEEPYKDLPGTGDYELWIRLLRQTRGSCLRSAHTVYRQQGETMTTRLAGQLPQATLDLIMSQLSQLLGTPIEVDEALDLVRLESGALPDDWRASCRTWRRLMRHLSEMPELDPEVLAQVNRTTARRVLRRAPTTSAPGAAWKALRCALAVDRAGAASAFAGGSADEVNAPGADAHREAEALVARARTWDRPYA